MAFSSAKSSQQNQGRIPLTASTLKQWALLVVMAVSSMSAAGQTLHFDPSMEPLKIWPFALRLTTTPETSIEQVRLATDWTTTFNKTPGVGFSDQAEWLQFKLANNTDESVPVRFFWHHAQIHEADIYVYNGDEQANHLQLGTLIPLEDRPHKSRMLEWSVQLPENSVQTFFIRAKSPFAISFRIKVGNPNDIEEMSRMNDAAAYLYLGIMLALLLYNFTIAFSTGERSYWFYITYVFFITLYVLGLLGYGFKWGLVTTPEAEQRFIFSLIPVFLIAALFFSRNFLQIFSMPKPLKITFWALVGFEVVCFGLGLTPHREGFIMLASPSALAVILFILFCSLWAVALKRSYAVFFTLGWLSMLFGITGHQTSVLFGVYSDWFGQESLKTGTALEALFLSWAIGVRIQKLRDENRKLENEAASALEEANAQLVQRLRIQKDATQQKDDLLNIISHELKTPLNVMHSTLEMVHNSEDQAFPSETLKHLSYGSERLRRSVDNLVMLSEFNSGRSRLTEQPVHLATVIVELTETAEAHLGQKQTWQLSLPEDTDVWCMVDERKLIVLLENLLENAFKFAPDGEVKLGLAIEDQHLAWTIEDSGIGMSPEERQIIFDTFRQADQTTTRAAEGLGLGLALVSRIANLLDGKLDIESTLNQGTKVTFKLPFKPAPQMDGAMANGRRALIVEDNAINAKLMIRLAEKLGIQTDVVENGAQAINAIQEGGYDLVFMDIQMPVMDGFEATKHIRAAGFSGAIIAVTANDTSSDREKAFACGMDEFIGKPVRFNTLRAKLFSLNLLGEPATTA